MTVVIHYSGTGESATVQEIDRLDGDGLKVSEGRVTSIDREKGEIKVRLDDNPPRRSSSPTASRATSASARSPRSWIERPRLRQETVATAC